MLQLADLSLTSDWLIFSLSIIHCRHGDPVDRVQLCTIDRVTLSSSVIVCTIDRVPLPAASTF